MEFEQELKNKHAQEGITLTTPIRKNLARTDKVDNRLLGKGRKVMETVFSNFESLGIHSFKSRSFQAFDFLLEPRLLVYALMLKKTQKRFVILA